jgi:hypothetical protein
VRRPRRRPPCPRSGADQKHLTQVLGVDETQQVVDVGFAARCRIAANARACRRRRAGCGTRVAYVSKAACLVACRWTPDSRSLGSIEVIEPCSPQLCKRPYPAYFRPRRYGHWAGSGHRTFSG